MKKGIKKLIILALIFIAVIGAFIWMNRGEKENTQYTVMAEASLPVVRLRYGEYLINELRGYRVRMDGKTVREGTYPLGGELIIPVQVSSPGEAVTAIGYEVRSLDETRLIESKKNENLVKESDGVYSAEIRLMDLLERDEEYQVMFTVFLADGTESYHYVRVSFEGKDTVAGAVEFALEFSEKTFLDEPDAMLIAQLESNASADNSSFSYTDIYSSYSHVLWEGLRPEKTGEMQITIHDVDRLITSLVLSYDMTAVDENGGNERYRVREFYCIRHVNEKYYLMTYERLAEELFADGEEEIREDGSLELGVIGREDLSMSIIRQGAYTVFVKNGVLWCYDAKEDVLGTLFAFDAADGKSDAGDAAGIKVVRVGEQGNVDFIVYGYMESGSHEGQSGIAYYQYQAKEDALREVFFARSDRSGEQLKEDVGRLCYLSENGLFYLFYKDTVYAIDLEGGEYAQLISGLSKDQIAVDEKAGIMAWQEGEDKGGNRIVLYSLNTGESRVLETPKEERCRLIGFIGDDLLYGLLRETDMEKHGVYSAMPPFYALEIVSMTGEPVSRYEKQGMYLTDVEILTDRVKFSRKGFKNGAWEDMGEDILFSRTAQEKEKESILKSSISARKKRIYRLDLELTEKTIVRYHCPKLIVQESHELALGTREENPVPRYYAYSYGKLQGIYTSPAEAIVSVNDALGVVLNDEQQVVWNRGNRGSSVSISMPVHEPVASPGLEEVLELYLQKLGTGADVEKEIAEGMNICELLRTHTEKQVLDLEGCTLEQMLFYLDARQPVLGFAEDDRAVLLIGYKELYGDKSLLIYSPETAQAVEYAFEEVETWFDTSGNRFISVLP